MLLLPLAGRSRLPYDEVWLGIRPQVAVAADDGDEDEPLAELPRRGSAGSPHPRRETIDGFFTTTAEEVAVADWPGIDDPALTPRPGADPSTRR